MPKILIFSDLHLHNHKKSNERLDDCLQTLNWIFDTAKDRNIKTIVCVGDLFHTRQKIDVLTYQRTFEIFDKHKEFNIWLLIGNHDMWYEHDWDVSSVIPLGVLPNVHVVINPCDVEIDGFPACFLPYTKNPLDSLNLLKHRDLLFAHVAVHGALMNTRSQTHAEEVIEHDGDMVKIDEKVFGNWKRVFLGHYHAYQNITNKIGYIGSPLQLSYGESFDKKYIAIYDLATDDVELVENTFSPKHFVIKPNDINKINFGDRAFIRVQVNDINSPDNIEIQKSISNLCENVSEIKIESIKKKIIEDKQIVEDAKSILMNDEEMAEKYIDQIGNTNLDRTQLLSIFNIIRMKRELNV
jgi:DNA repair exonuclease SbcCD nuclease subunit